MRFTAGATDRFHYQGHPKTENTGNGITIPQIRKISCNVFSSCDRQDEVAKYRPEVIEA